MADLFLAARVGDLDRVRYLVEARGHDVNIINEYDVSPLYNAALCGHTHVVKYLLEKGAVVEEGSYHGERCYYAALTDDLRRLLKTYRQLTAAYRCPFLESMRLMYESREKLWPDMAFQRQPQQVAAVKGGGGEGVAGEEAGGGGGGMLFCHQVILRSRSPFIRRCFRSHRWKNNHNSHASSGGSSSGAGGDGDSIATRCIIRLSREVSPQVFQAVLQYMYTGRLELPGDHLVADCYRICSKLELHYLKEALGMRMEQQRGRKANHGQVVLEPSREDLVHDLKHLASEVLGRFSEDADVCIGCDGRYFSLHRVILAGRSPYFNTMLTSSGFAESLAFHHHQQQQQRHHDSKQQQQQHRSKNDDDCGGGGGGSSDYASRPHHPLPTIQIGDLSWAAFAKVIEWCYSDQVEGLNVPEVFEVLDAATRFLMDGLRALCTSIIINDSDLIDPYYMYSIALTYNLPRLENHCFSVFARDLDEVVDKEEFMALVEDSARSIQHREETDSIPLVDDVRWWIQRLHATQPEEAARKYELVDLMLERLSLSA